MSRSIYALESKEERSVDEEQQLRQLLASRSDLLVKVKAESATTSPSQGIEPCLDAASKINTPSEISHSSIFHSILSSVAEATHASVGLAKSVAGLLIESAADTARLCAPPPPSLEQTLKQLDSTPAMVPPCILHILPLEFQALPPPAPIAVTQVVLETRP